MRIRRALAAAAATAAIVPAALLAAPSAYADGQDGSNGTTTGTSQTTGTDPAGSAQETDKNTTESGKDSTGSSEATQQDDGADTNADDQKNGDEQPAGQQDDTKTGGDDSGTTGTSGTSGTTDTSGTSGTAGDTDTAGGTTSSDDSSADEPQCTEGDFSTSLTAFPNKIVAGSGWHDFTLVLDNGDGKAQRSIDIGATILYQKDADSEYDTLAAKYATMEYFDPGSHEWLNSRGDLGDTTAQPGEFQGNVDVAAGGTLSLKMRVRIHDDAPAGGAVAIAAGFYDSKSSDSCQMDVEWYSFDVVAAGHHTGDVVDAKPQGGAVPIDLKPQGHVQQIGTLAETGADSSQLTAIGLSGAAALVLGAGALVVLRRRKAGAGA